MAGRPGRPHQDPYEWYGSSQPPWAAGHPGRGPPHSTPGSAQRSTQPIPQRELPGETCRPDARPRACMPMPRGGLLGTRSPGPVPGPSPRPPGAGSQQDPMSRSVLGTLEHHQTGLPIWGNQAPHLVGWGGGHHGPPGSSTTPQHRKGSCGPFCSGQECAPWGS